MTIINFQDDTGHTSYSGNSKNRKEDTQLSRIICAVLNDSPDYVNRFLTYFRTHRRYPFDVIGFTSHKSLEEYLSDSVVDILLLSQDFRANENDNIREEEPVYGSEAMQSDNIREIVFLGEQQDLTTSPKCINCFRPMKLIAQDIAQISEALKISDEHAGSSLLSIIGLYSISRTLDPLQYASKLADKSSDDQNILFIDMDTFSPYERGGANEGNLTMSELIFSYLTDKELFSDTLRSALLKKENLTMLTAPSSLKDLDEISSLGWKEFLHSIALEGAFSTLILHISDSCRDMPGLFGLCNTIYLLADDDSPYAVARTDAFRHYFEIRGRTDILDHFEKAI